MKPQRTVDYGWHFLIYRGETLILFLFICINGVLKKCIYKERAFNAEKC